HQQRADARRRFVRDASVPRILRSRAERHTQHRQQADEWNDSYRRIRPRRGATRAYGGRARRHCAQWVRERVSSLGGTTHADRRSVGQDQTANRPGAMKMEFSTKAAIKAAAAI